jgi:GxxExxY protein
MSIAVHKENLIYPELSYKIIGLAFNIYNELGFGHLEKTYQKALAKELRDNSIRFSEQVKYSVEYKGEIIGNNYLDFLIEDTVIIELKKSGYMSKKNIEQISNYLKVSKLKLALVIIFTPEGVRIKRVVNDF